VGYPARPDKLGQEIEASSMVESVDPEVSTGNTTDFTGNPIGDPDFSFKKNGHVSSFKIMRFLHNSTMGKALLFKFLT